MVAGPVIGALVFGIAPLIFIAWYSLHDWAPLTGRFDFVGLANFVELADSSTFRTSLMVTAIFVLGVVVSETVVALVLATLLNRRMRGIGTFRAAYFAPVVIAYAAWALVWDYLLASNGAINTFLASLGIAGPDWLNSPSWALVSVIPALAGLRRSRGHQAAEGSNPAFAAQSLNRSRSSAGSSRTKSMSSG